MQRFCLRLVGMLIGGLLVSPYALASPPDPTAFPTKPIILMVPWTAGGSTDIGARIVAGLAQKELGQSIVVINKAGAGGQVGWTELAKQKPDGYYIGAINIPAINTCILDPDRKATFSIDSFKPIINQVLDPGVIYVKNDSPHKTLKDLIEDARNRPGEVKAGTTGILGDDHLAILMLEEAANVKFRIVHFEGDTPQVTALLGGQIDVSFLNVGGIVPRVKSGHMKPLVAMDSERSKFFPDLPTTVELGYPTVLSNSTRGFIGPKGISDPIIKKLQAAFQKAMEDPEHVDKMDKAGLATKIMMGEEYNKYVKGVHEKMKRLVEKGRKAR